MVVCPQFLAFIVTFGLPSALLYNLKRDPARASQLFSAALLLGTVIGFLAVVGGMLIIPHWLIEYSPEVVRFAQWLLLATPVASLNTIFANATLTRDEFTLYNALRYLPPLATLLALGLLILVQGLTPFNAALSYVLPGVPLL